MNIRSGLKYQVEFDELMKDARNPEDPFVIHDHPPVFPEGTNIQHGHRKGVTCSGIYYRSREGLMKEVRSRIIERYRDYLRFSAEDLQFVVNVLSLGQHGNEEKIGGGVVAGWIEPNERYNQSGMGTNRTIHVKRAADGVSVDVSWRQAISHPTPESEAKRAMRFDTEEYIRDWKEKEFVMKGDQEGSLTCPVLGVPIDRFSCEVHHQEPFMKIVEDFVASHVPAGLGSIETESLGNRLTGITIKDPEIRKLWVDFHNGRARLVILSKEGHRRITTGKDQMDNGQGGSDR